MSRLRPGVAAGHPATVDAGIEILEDGGSAADAAVAACLASCVAETVMTGLLGGGHGIYFDAASGKARLLDCFVAMPGLGSTPREAALVELQVPFGTELVHYAVGAGSCGVPGLPAGLDALWREHGRLPWERLVEPALGLARSGVPFPPAHAACLEMLAPVMTMNEGARIYSPAGTLLGSGERLEQPGLVAALEAVASEGAASVYRGSIGEALLALIDERDGLLTRRDLEEYDATWSEPDEVSYRGARFRTRRGLSDVPAALMRLPPLRGASEPERALAFARAFGEEASDGHTTNLVTVDLEGNACVLTTSLGLGSGDFLPGLDLHLNSMLGERDLIRRPLEPGERVASMMSPAFAQDDSGLVLAAGAAGGTRLRSALVQVVAGVLDEGLDPADAVARPRLHPSRSERPRSGPVEGVWGNREVPPATTIHLEPGFQPETIERLEQEGYEPRAWQAQHHYFGGVSVITRIGAAGDPRRSGAARRL
jgi:gamma-glutamyltranspeptidase/glutathione hydrolase